jgi:hypothetical protein
MQIYDRYNDGDKIMDRLASKLKGGCEFLMSGEGSDDPYHSWSTSYYLRRSPTGRYFGLKADSPRSKVSVIIEDPEVSDLREIARLLIDVCVKFGLGNRIDMVHMLGDLMEEPILEQKAGKRRSKRKTDDDPAL